MSNGTVIKLPWNSAVSGILWVLRFAVGLLFIFSGLIKANDPLGFGYKLHDYYEVFGSGRYPLLSWMDNALFTSTTTETAMFICILEVALGVALIIGFWPRFVSWIMLLMIIFFTFLTGFSHYTGEVQECGCFGDAIPLTAKQSYIKDIILLVVIVFIFLYRSRITALFRKTPSRVVMILAVIAPWVFTVWAVNHLPFRDFRAYKVGNDLCALKALPPDAKKTIYESTLVYNYAPTSEQREFSMEDFTRENIGYDTNWVFVETRNKLIQMGDRPKVNLIIRDQDQTDVTDAILQDPSWKFFLVAYDIDHTSRKRWKKINALQEMSEAAGFLWYGLSSSGESKVEEFRHEVQIPIEFYTADATELKTIIRSNPGLVLMKGCVVKGQWHWRDVPGWERVQRMTQ